MNETTTVQEMVETMLRDHLATLHPRDAPPPPRGTPDGGPGACLGCNAALGYHHGWCAQRGASDAEIAKLRAGS